MSENKFETVSGLVDNYQQDIEELDCLLNDEHLAQRWENYHLIGDVLRDEIPSEIPLNLSAQIASAISEEPTILVPKHRKIIQKTKAKVIQLSKPFGQMAIAASAAGLMIFSVQQTNVAENDTVIPTHQVIQTTPFGGVANPVSLNYQTPNPAAKKQAYINQQRRFQALLVDHQQQVKLSAATNENKAKDKAEELPK